MKRSVFCLLAAPLCLLLSGCTLVNFLLSGCGGAEADLVVTNDSPLVVGSITLDYGDQTEMVVNADGTALLERGDSYGLELEDGAERVVVALADLDRRELARCLVDFAGERLYLTLEADGTLSLSEEEPAGG